MTFSEAEVWSSNFVYHDSLRNVDYHDWRLARYIPVDGKFNYTYATDGSGDFGSNIVGSNAELAHINNVDLKEPINSGIIHNLQFGSYWYETLYEPKPFPVLGAFYFDRTNNVQLVADLNNQYNAWAVRDGDVAVSAVPVPAATWLFLSGLMGVLAFNCRKNKTANVIAA